MIWGRKMEDRNVWHPWFVLRPIKMIDGRWAWLHWVERCHYFANHISVRATHTLFGGWCFREAKKLSDHQSGDN
jgi:hypothetical protein